MVIPEYTQEEEARVVVLSNCASTLDIRDLPSLTTNSDQTTTRLEFVAKTGGPAGERSVPVGQEEVVACYYNNAT